MCTVSFFLGSRRSLQATMNEIQSKKSAVAKALFEHVPKAGYRKRLPTRELSAIASQILAISPINSSKFRNIAVDGVLMLPDREPSGSNFKAQSSADIQLAILHSTEENPRGAHTCQTYCNCDLVLIYLCWLQLGFNASRQTCTI